MILCIGGMGFFAGSEFTDTHFVLLYLPALLCYAMRDDYDVSGSCCDMSL